MVVLNARRLQEREKKSEFIFVTDLLVKTILSAEMPQMICRRERLVDSE